jgi:hypothetical protein
MSKFETAKSGIESTGSTGSKGVTKTYGESRGGKGAEKTVLSRSENDSGANGELAAASARLYRNSRDDGNPGEAGASIKAIQER